MTLFEFVIGTAPFLILAAVLIVAAVSWYIARLSRRADRLARSQYPEGEVLLTESDVNLAEHRSSGNRMRGNGVLVLTREEIAFQSWEAARLRVPLAAIQQVEKVQITVGGRTARPLLRIHYTDLGGVQDVAGWLVAGASEWEERIEHLRARIA